MLNLVENEFTSYFKEAQQTQSGLFAGISTNNESASQSMLNTAQSKEKLSKKKKSKIQKSKANAFIFTDIVKTPIKLGKLKKTSL